MDVNQFARQWPYCFHVTFAVNLGLIKTFGCLYSAKTLLSIAGEIRSCHRRMTEQVIYVRGQPVVLRNQRALNPQALDLPCDCSLDDYIAFLNERAYFWPGTSTGPVADGIHLLAGHGSPMPAAMIRVGSKSLMELNEHAAIYVATCNTGASWADGSGKSRRAPDFFRPLPEYSGDSQAIVEVSFVKSARLPNCSEYSTTSVQGWELLSCTTASQLAL
jgi:hypothetical protein